MCKHIYTWLTYRTTNIAKISPIITITHAPTVPPTVTGKLSNGKWDNSILFVVTIEKDKALYYNIISFVMLGNISNWKFGFFTTLYIIYKIQLSKDFFFRNQIDIPSSQFPSFSQPYRQLPLYLSHVWLMHFPLHWYSQFTP